MVSIANGGIGGNIAAYLTKQKPSPPKSSGPIPIKPKPVPPVSKGPIPIIPKTPPPKSSGPIPIKPIIPPISQASIESRQKAKAASDAALAKLEGKAVTVKYRTPAGFVKTFRTQRLKSSVDEGGIPGEIMSIGYTSPHRGGKPQVFYDVSKQVLATEAHIPGLKRKFSESGYQTVPQWYQTQVQLPDVVKELGITKDYLRYHYSSSLGMLGSDFSKSVDKLIEKNMTQAYAKEHYRWDDKTWKQLKKEDPAIYMTGTGKGITVSQDISRWQREEHKRAEKEGDWGYLAGEWFGEVFTPKRIDYALASLSGGQIIDKEGYVVGSKSPESYLSEGHYSFYQKQRKGDWVGIGIEAIQSPIVFPFVATGAFKVGSFAVRAASPAFKTAVTKVPSVFGKVPSKFPTVFDTTRLESGAILRTPSSKFVSNIGSSQMYKNIQGWASGSLTRVKTIPMKGVPITRSLGGGVFQRIIKYKGFAKVSWEPSRIAYQTPLGKTGTAGVTFTKSTAGHGFRSTASFEYISKPKGVLWSKRATQITTSYDEFIPSPFSSPATTGATDVWGGFIKPYSSYEPYTFIATKSKPSILWDTSASASLTHHVTHVPSHGGRMHVGSFLQGTQAGSPFALTYPTTMFSIPVSSSTIGTVVTSGLLFGSGYAHKPRYDFKSSLGYVTKPGYDIIYKSAQGLNLIQRQSYAQFQESDVLQSMLQDSEQLQRQQQARMQKLIPTQSLVYKTVQKTKAATAFLPKPLTIFKPHVLKPIILPSLSDGEITKVKRRKEWDVLDKGYHHREWKTLTMKEFLGGI